MGRALSAWLLIAATAACVSDAALERRDGVPLGEQTIFSPLDLPAPNDVRLGSGAPGPAYWQQRVDWTIDARLDPESRRLSATGRFTYHNASPHPLDYLWLNIEQNLFRPDSLGAAVGTRTAVALTEAQGEGLAVTALSSGGRALEFVVHDTLGRIDLPAPLAAGASAEFEIAWEFVVPERVFRRFGIERVEQGTIWQLAQWVPQPAVYDDVHGWNTLPYIGSGEFYTNFGDWDVSITVPREHVLVATGELQNAGEVFTAEQAERLAAARGSDETIVIRGAEGVGDAASRPAGEGPLTWRFRAENVRTFAFATSEAYILDAAGLDGVLLMSAYPKEAQPLWESSTQMMRKAIAGYARRWHPYPYPVAINANGPEGGMEYPMIVFCKERKNEEGLYGVTTHELGHEWFPMMVNTDERRHAWMDEGFNSFINHYSRADWFDTPSHGGRSSPDAMARFMAAAPRVPVDTKPDALPRQTLGMLQYAKPAAGLVLLREQILGPERFDHAFRTYIRRWAFKAPRPADFFRTMEDAAGADLAWFWRGWFLSSETLDQSVEEIVEATDAHPQRVTFMNRGGLVMPLVYEVTWEDGSAATFRLPVEVWFHSNVARQLVDGPQRIRSVRVDPDHAFPDTDRTNNTWPR